MRIDKHDRIEFYGKAILNWFSWAERGARGQR